MTDNAKRDLTTGVPSAEYADLIKRLADATEPSRDLDRAIMWLDLKIPERFRSDADNPRHYTSSFDAALTLLRKHYLWEVKQGIGCYAIVWWIEKDWDDTGAPTGYSTTYPALALCTAAIMARAVEDRALSLLTETEGRITSGEPQQNAAAIVPNQQDDGSKG